MWLPVLRIGTATTSASATRASSVRSATPDSPAKSLTVLPRPPQTRGTKMWRDQRGARRLAIGHPEKVADWGHRAVHETAVAAKALIRAYYGKPEKLSFWSSCHEGGNQALTEAQKYPTDYDAIAAGDPAYYITHLQAMSEYTTWVALKDGVKAPGYIPPSKYPVIHRAALDQCDALDGVRDGYIEDPTRCHFDPETIRCPGKADLASCLTEPQVQTAKLIYAGPKLADGKQIYPGFDPGSELGWGLMAAGPQPLSISTGFFKAIVFQNPNWDFRTFDVDRDTKLAESKDGAPLDSNNPDLKPFKDHGGKLLIYQSWDEAIIPPRSMIDYYKNVLAAMVARARQITSSAFSWCPAWECVPASAWETTAHSTRSM